MIWLVWDNVGESEADALRIDAPDCIEAAEEWARRDSDADTANLERHFRDGLDLRCRAADANSYTYRVEVDAEATVHYSGRAMGVEP